MAAQKKPKTHTGSSPIKTAGLTPIKAKDMALLRYATGTDYTNLRWLLGGTAATIAQGSDNDRILPPSLAILIRFLWNNPEDRFLPEEPTFDQIRKRFGKFNPPKRGQSAGLPKTTAAVLTGSRRVSGSEWGEGGNQPSPQIRRLFWVLSLVADKYGEEEAWNRWMRAVDEEAAARGSNREDIIKAGRWPYMPGEARYRGKDGETETSDEDGD